MGRPGPGGGRRSPPTPAWPAWPPSAASWGWMPSTTAHPRPGWPPTWTRSARPASVRSARCGSAVTTAFCARSPAGEDQVTYRCLLVHPARRGYVRAIACPLRPREPRRLDNCASVCGGAPMETPLTPLEFARRTRRLHGHREGVVDGDLRLTYEQFFDHCDRWSGLLQDLGVGRGDRVATIAPNTHAQLASFYSVPQLGAVLVPINYRLTPDDFVYIVDHSGSSVLCVDEDYLDAVDSVRGQLRGVRHFVAFGGARDGWLDYPAAVAAAGPDFTRAEIDERDLLTINYTSGTTARPKGVMITHRNAAVNSIGTLLHLPMAVGERYLWTLPMFHANGWTYTWTVTAAAATHICLRKVEPGAVFQLIRDERIGSLCAAPTVLISLANAPA